MDAMKSLKLKCKQGEENGNGPFLKAKKVDDRFSFDIEDSQIDLFSKVKFLLTWQRIQNGPIKILNPGWLLKIKV